MNYTGFYTGGERSTNDVGDSPHHLPDISYDVFCITVQQRRYATY